jgi:hypothetical protein
VLGYGGGWLVADGGARDQAHLTEQRGTGAQVALSAPCALCGGMRR